MYGLMQIISRASYIMQTGTPENPRSLTGIISSVLFMCIEVNRILVIKKNFFIKLLTLQALN